MTSEEVMMTMGNRENFMCRWFEWLPPELKIEIMMMIPGWKRELAKGDFVKFKMNIPTYDSHRWNNCWRFVNGLVTEYIFSEEKKKFEYCIEFSLFRLGSNKFSQFVIGIDPTFIPSIKW